LGIFDGLIRNGDQLQDELDGWRPEIICMILGSKVTESDQSVATPTPGHSNVHGQVREFEQVTTHPQLPYPNWSSRCIHPSLAWSMVS